MKKAIMVMLSAVMIFSAVSCVSPVYGEELKSSKERETSPNVSQVVLQALVDGNTEFALELYRQLGMEDGNLFYSPYSLSLALAMTYAGAEGETRQQMADVLRYIFLEDEELHTAFNKLALELASRGEDAEGKDDEGFRLNVVNAIWGQKDFGFLSDFLDVLAKNYGAGLRILDFISNPE